MRLFKHKKTYGIMLICTTALAIIIAGFLYNANSYCDVVFKDDNGNILYIEKVKKGTMPTFRGELPNTEDDKEFFQWNPEITVTTCDTEYVATYQKKQKKDEDRYYEVTFYDEDKETILQKIKVKEGEIPKYDELVQAYPELFEGWDKELMPIYSNMNYVAKIHHHSWNLVESRESSCVIEGYEKYKCIGCEAEFINRLPLLEHNYDVEDVDPTCTENGYRNHKCIMCGERYKNHYSPALGHAFERKAEDVHSDEVDGMINTYKAYICTRCNEEYEEYSYTDFSFVGDIQEYTILKNGTYKIEVWGAQGGGTNGGKGAYAYGEVELHEGDILYVVVGGQGNKRDGGYNGGGRGQKQAGSVSPSGYGGGGATHIALSSGLLYELEDHKEDILIVAGAGGGASESGKNGGAGGLVGGNGQGGTLNGKGGTQDAGGAAGDRDVEPGSFGKGGNNDGVQPKTGTWGSGGGGAGYYGGGASSWSQGRDNSSGGAGGSSYITGLENADVTSGDNEGNGKAKISYISE